MGLPAISAPLLELHWPISIRLVLWAAVREWLVKRMRKAHDPRCVAAPNSVRGDAALG
jgi:branched-subunit amino acid permease